MRWIKALRDLTVNPARSFLTILALVLGIGGAGTILVSYVILTNDLNANYQSTIPPHVVYRSKQLPALDLKTLTMRPEVESAELRDFSLHRIEVYPDVWIPVWMYGVENFEDFHLARVFHESGVQVPPSGTILIERDGLKVSNIRPGSTARIRIGSNIQQVKVSGICFDPAQAPATQDAFIYAYMDKKTYHQITSLPVNQRLLVRFKNVHSAEEVAEASDRLAKYLRSAGVAIDSIQIPRFNEHPHQWQLNTLLFLIGSIGFLAFLMGAVLVSQLIRTVLASQVRQIGILKSIGASRFQVLEIYFTMLFIIGLCAGAIAIPLAALSGNAFSAFVAKILNFNILTTTVPPRVYFYLISASLLLPAILSLSTLLKGTSISVKDALSDYGITPGKKTKEWNLLKKIPLPKTFILAFRNSFRNSRRLMVTMLAMALGVAIFSTGFNVRQSLWELLSQVKNEMRYDVQVVLNKQTSTEEALRPFLAVGNVKKIETWIGGRGELQSKLLSTDKGAGITALPYHSQLLKMKVVSGRWLQASRDTEVVMNRQAWELYQKPQPGTQLSLNVNGKNIKVKLAGITEEFDKAKIYIDKEKYDSKFNPGHLINTLVFVAENNDYQKVITLKKNIEKAIASSSLDVLYVMSQAERVQIIYDHLNIILMVILLLSFLVLVVSAIGMASAMSISIRERTREIGVMRAIGASPRKIYRLFVTEGMIVSIFSIVLGVLFAFPLSSIAAAFFGKLILGPNSNLQYAFSVSGFFITLAVTVVFGWISGMVPARAAVRIPTHEALSYE